MFRAQLTELIGWKNALRFVLSNQFVPIAIFFTNLNLLSEFRRYLLFAMFYLLVIFSETQQTSKTFYQLVKKLYLSIATSPSP